MKFRNFYKDNKLNFPLNYLFLLKVVNNGVQIFGKEIVIKSRLFSRCTDLINDSPFILNRLLKLNFSAEFIAVVRCMIIFRKCSH